MERIKKRVLALLLSCCLVTVGTVGTYQTTQAAEIVAGGAIVGTLEEILLSFGIFLLPSSMTEQAQSSDWWYSEDGNAALKPYYDDLASEYEKERFKVINGSGGDSQPSTTPEPETETEPGITPVPGEIPTFDELIAPALAGGAITWANGAFEVMGNAINNFWNKFMGRASNVDMELPDDIKDMIESSGFPYYMYTIYNSGEKSESIYLYLGGIGSYCYSNRVEMPGHAIIYKNGKVYMDSNYINTGFKTSNYKTNMPIFKTEADGEKWSAEQLANADKYVKENIWVHPDLQETYQNNGKFEYPQEAPQPLQYPSAENLADLAKKLNPEINTEYSPEMAPSYVQELIRQLQQNPGTDTDAGTETNPDPNPNPNPDTGTDTDTDAKPTAAPEPEATGTPGESSDSKEELGNYTADLTSVFPFCIPFDLIHLFEVLDAEPEAPVFKIPVELKANNPFNGKSVINYKDTIVIDLSDYEQAIKVIRIFEVIFFLIGLMLITRSHMIKG